MGAYEHRHQWGAEGNVGGYRIGRVSEVICHHFYRPHVAASATVADEREVMRAVQRFHKHDRGWQDIGYQFVVFQSGRAYAGRGWFQSGAHTHGRNSRSVGIAFAIDGDRHTPTDAAWETARQIVAEGIRIGAVTPDYTLSGHQDYVDYAKTCPGEKTYPIIGEHLSSSLVVQEDDMRSYAQAVVVPETSDWDRALGAVVAATYRLALVETGDGQTFRSLTHDGEDAEVTDWVEVVGAAEHPRSDTAHRIAGADRWETAREVADFLRDHDPDEWVRRGRPY